MSLNASESNTVKQVARLAQGLLGRRGNLPGNDLSLTDRLFAAGINNLAALDALIVGDRRAACEKLGLQTLDESDRILTALGRARREIRNKPTLPGA